MTFRDLLLGSAFHLVSNHEDQTAGPRLNAWGRVGAGSFDGQAGRGFLDGAVTTANLGLDAVWERWLTEVALAYSDGDGSYTAEAGGGACPAA